MITLRNTLALAALCIAASLVLPGCETAGDMLMAISDDPCADKPGCTVEAPDGNAGRMTFRDADGEVIADWSPMAVTGAP